MKTYHVKVGNETRFTFRANLAEASAPIYYGECEPTPYQSADAKHNSGRAAELLIRWVRAQTSGPGVVARGEQYRVTVA